MINAIFTVAIAKGLEQLEVRYDAIVADLEHLLVEQSNRGKDRCLCRVVKTLLKTNQTL